MAVHAVEARFPNSAAQRLLSASLARHEQAAWWQESNELFRVVMCPIVAGAGTEQRELGLLAVGQHINAVFAQGLAHSSASQIVLISGDSIVASTLDERALQEFAREVHFQQAAPRQLQIGIHHFDVSIVDLQTSPDVSFHCYMLLPLDSIDAYLHRLNRIILLLGSTRLEFGSETEIWKPTIRGSGWMVGCSEVIAKPSPRIVVPAVPKPASSHLRSELLNERFQSTLGFQIRTSGPYRR